MSAKLFGSAACVNETTAAPREGLIDFSFSPLIARICRGDFPIRSYMAIAPIPASTCPTRKRKTRYALNSFFKKFIKNPHRQNRIDADGIVFLLSRPCKPKFFKEQRNIRVGAIPENIPPF